MRVSGSRADSGAGNQSTAKPFTNTRKDGTTRGHTCNCGNKVWCQTELPTPIWMQIGLGEVASNPRIMGVGDQVQPVTGRVRTCGSERWRRHHPTGSYHEGGLQAVAVRIAIGTAHALHYDDVL